MRPDVSIVIVTHNRADLALATIRSMRDRLGAVTAEWLVVDSGSGDGTPAAIEAAFPDVEVMRRGNIGFAAGNNVALERATGRYVLLLNPDIEVRDGELAGLIAELDADPRVGAASVVQESPAGQVLPSIRRFPTPARQWREALALTRVGGAPAAGELEERPAAYRAGAEADWLVGAFLVVRSEAVAAVGLLDERFFLYSEETDWCYRIKAAGWRVRHYPSMAVIHHTGDYARPDLAAQLSWSKLLFARKHFRPAATASVHLALVVHHGVRLLAALLRGAPARRSRAESRSLAVLLGLKPPPFAELTQR
jgi:N-acetylglucosaminyl-diphospho-decaprenol L-rhamnosyltransferase